MSIQLLINRIGNEFSLEGRAMRAMQMTRNQITKTTVTVTTQPFIAEFNLRPMPWNEAREMLAYCAAIDRISSESVYFNTAGTFGFVRYQGPLSLNQRNSFSFQSFNGNQLVLQSAQVIAAGTPVVLAGDFIQIVGKPFPFQAITPALMGNDGRVTITTHRPNIFSTQPTVGSGVKFGAECEFKFQIQEFPVILHRPGARLTVNGSPVNRSYVELDGNVRLVESTKDA